jgi:hypothetical protein
MVAQAAVSPISREDFDFQLFEVLDILRLTKRGDFADHDRDTFTAALDLAERIA